MKAAAKFYVCEHCGNVMELIQDGGVRVKCCGVEMKELTPNTSDGAAEKHAPKVNTTGEKVEVLAEHPITKEHSILWIALETTKGMQRKYIHQEYVSTSDVPKAIFVIVEEEPVAAYAYCNLHGLWKTDITMA